MLFLYTFIEVLPAKYKKRDNVAAGHPKAFSAFLAFILVLRSILAWTGSFNVNVVPYCVPVVALEACGLYFTALVGLREAASVRAMAAMYAAFLAGAVVETLTIVCLTV
jgi:hypothetical protein